MPAANTGGEYRRGGARRGGYCRRGFGWWLVAPPLRERPRWPSESLCLAWVRPIWYGMAEWSYGLSWRMTARFRFIASYSSRLRGEFGRGSWGGESGSQPLANWLACLD